MRRLGSLLLCIYIQARAWESISPVDTLAEPMVSKRTATLLCMKPLYRVNLLSNGKGLDSWLFALSLFCCASFTFNYLNYCCLIQKHKSFTSQLTNYFTENFKMLFGGKKFSEILKWHKQPNFHHSYFIQFVSKHSLGFKKNHFYPTQREVVYICLFALNILCFFSSVQFLF